MQDPREIEPALGEFAADYDLDAIAAETFTYCTSTDERGRERADGHYVQTVTGEDFWSVVARHAR